MNANPETALAEALDRAQYAKSRAEWASHLLAYLHASGWSLARAGERDLDGAWQEAEAALPEGWTLGSPEWHDCTCDVHEAARYYLAFLDRKPSAEA